MATTGYLATAHSTSPYVTIYFVDGDSRVKLADPASLPSGQGRSAILSPDGVYLAVTSSSTPFLAIYKRSGDTFTKLTGGDGPDVAPGDDSWAAAWSSDSTYLAIASNNNFGSADPITIYKRTGDAFAKLADPPSMPTTVCASVAWSPDDTYLAVGASSGGQWRIYKRSGDSFTSLTLPTAFANDVNGCAWSPDGTYVSWTGNSSPNWGVLKRSGDTFTLLTGLAAVSGVGFSTDWDSTGTFVAVAHNNSPYLSVFERSGDTFTKIADPATLPPSGPNSYANTVAWSPTDSHLAVATNSSPYLTTYTWNSSTKVLTALASPATLPPDTTRGISWYFNPPSVDAVGSAPGTSTVAASHASTGPMSSIAASSGVASATAVGATVPPTAAYITFPALSTWTISAGTGDGLYGTLPALTSWTIVADTGAGMVNTLPALSTWTVDATSEFSTYAQLTAPMWSMDAIGSPAMYGDNTFSPWELTATLVTGTISSAASSMPALVLDATTGSYAVVEIPITLEASGLAGAVGNATLELPAVTLQTAIDNSTVATATLLAPAMSIAAAGLAENDCSVDEVFKPVRLVSTGVVGYAGQVSVELPAIVLNAAAHSDNVATAAGEVPMWYVDADAFSAIVEAYRAWALNVSNAALTEYTGMSFNSFGTFQGRVLAAGSTGLHVVGEADLDNTTKIDALIRTALVDFGTSYNKRVPRAYVGLKAVQDMEFHTITTHDGTRAYLIPRNGNEDAQQRRVPIGRGPKARFWQFGLSNRDGGDFTVIDVLVYPEVIGRRVV